MTNDTDDQAKNKNSSIKNRIKAMRREAYLRAKEFKKNDPREIARKALAKQQRQAIYQKAKERSQAMKKSSKTKFKLEDKLVRACDLAPDNRPLAPVIPIDIHRFRQKT